MRAPGPLAWMLRGLLWSVTVLLAQSAFWADVALPMKALVASVALLSAWRPQYGLLAVAGLVPFGNALAVRMWAAPSFGLSEAIVLAFLAGGLIPRPRSSTQPPVDAVTATGLMFGLIILATCAVQVAIERAWQNHWDRFLLDFIRYLTFDYLTAQPDVRPWVAGPGFLPPAILWLEGIALALITRSMCRQIPELPRRILMVVAAAAAGTALLTGARILDVARTTGASPLAVALSPERWTFAIPSINPSGAYFAMTSLVALGLAWGGRTAAARAAWLAAAVTITAAAWATKSRAAILAWTSMAGALLIRGIIRRRYAVLAAVFVALATGAFVLMVNPFGIVRAGGDESLRYREILVRGSARMIAEYPMFGVGIRQFKLRFHEFSPDAKGYVEDDPHNHLLGMATEMGLVGLGAFLLFLGTGIWQAARLLRVPEANGAAIGLCLGLAAFLITCLSHQPLGVPIVAFTFWMLFGTAIAWGQAAHSPAAGRTGFRRVALSGGAIAAIAILISVPFRARAATDGIDMTKVQYGFHDWDTDGRGTKFRWTSDHSTMFMSSEMSLINLPIGASLGGTPKGVNVRIFVDGELAGQLFLTDEAWHDVRLVAPRNGRKSWRIDLYVSPTVVPMEVNPAILDARRLGVRVGEPVQRELLRK